MAETKIEWAVTLHPDRLAQPLKWRKPRRVFVCSMGDLFHENVPDEFVLRVWAMMARCPQHKFLILTKRPKILRKYIGSLSGGTSDAVNRMLKMQGYQLFHRHILNYRRGFPLPNVHLGVSVEDQQTADERIPLLLQTPAAVRFVSYEPALGPVDFSSWSPFCFSCGGRLSYRGPDWVCSQCEHTDQNVNGTFLDGIIMGCESGPNARPMDIAYPRSVRDQCKLAGVPFFLKQMMVGGRLTHMPELDGQVHDDLPGGRTLSRPEASQLHDKPAVGRDILVDKDTGRTR